MKDNILEKNCYEAHRRFSEIDKLIETRTSLKTMYASLNDSSAPTEVKKVKLAELDGAIELTTQTINGLKKQVSQYIKGGG